MSERLALCSGDHPSQQKAVDHVLDIDTAENVARLFRALADPTRIRMIGVLAKAELCVGDLVQLLSMTQPAISHQLRILRDLRVVCFRKEGRHVYYSLDDEHIASLFQQGLTHALHD